jgi:hypothetical protein
MKYRKRKNRFCRWLWNFQELKSLVADVAQNSKAEECLYYRKRAPFTSLFNGLCKGISQEACRVEGEN